ncbi:hypothetical protein RRG08_016191 [Elysia crispata]|uniref:Uncharacterized protein n=1 Tax=Elysia crispata TaxID=231223 RepID=A0AAE1DJS7_9GAST|nr:hypothetical protein RRG08_016191 [Elysia crispata]
MRVYFRQPLAGSRARTLKQEINFLTLSHFKKKTKALCWFNLRQRGNPVKVAKTSSDEVRMKRRERRTMSSLNLNQSPRSHNHHSPPTVTAKTNQGQAQARFMFSLTSCLRCHN